MVSIVSSAYAKQPETITVFAASSLSPLLPGIVSDFEQQHDSEISVVYAGSGQLARQIQYGARADIFISANKVWSDTILKDANLTSHYAGNFANNHLVVVASNRVNQLPDSFEPRQVAWWQNALNGQRLAIGEPSSVPVGMYAKEALQQYSVWSYLSPFLAPSKSTRNALALVERGQTPIGIVYSSDANNSDGVTYVGRFDAESHADIVYPIVIIAPENDSESKTNATSEFSQYLLSDPVQEQIAVAGFRS
jgi:molybdate transport system substrate-binding protein